MDEEGIETIESVPSSQNNYYLDEESIETLEYVRPAGSIVPFSQDNYYLGYKHDPMEYEGATVDLQVTEDKKGIRDSVEERDSPETRRVHEDQHAKIEEINDESRDERMNQGEAEHDESSHTSYDKQTSIQSPGTWVAESLARSTLEGGYHRS